jgi:metal-sulfur cluster biosynthetic enzyme
MQKAGYTKDGNVLSVNVDITFDPPFTMDSVSDEAKLMMGW